MRTVSFAGAILRLVVGPALVCGMFQPCVSADGEGTASLSEPSPYTGFYTGDVLPTPRSMKRSGEAITVYDPAAGVKSCAVAIQENGSTAERLAAREIVMRIAMLAGKKDLDLEILRGRSENAVIEFSSAGKGTKPDGYAIRAETVAGRRRIVATGNGPSGTYFASKTLQQLLHEKEGRVIIDAVEIDDEPAFDIRSFKTGFERWDSIAATGKWAASFKWNTYNICYTSLGKDRWRDPSQEYRDTVAKLCAHMRERGLDIMTFVNPFYLWDSHLCIADEKGVEALAATSEIGLKGGGRKVMLCLDDFVSRERPHTLMHEEDVKAFTTLEKAHIHLIKIWRDRLKKDFPECELFVVLPYYWTPARYMGNKIEGPGNKYLREVGPNIPRDVTIVWTGPTNRSKVITVADIREYEGLIGQKAFLWDNTLYVHHMPRTYLLDAFTTTYPKDFAELNDKGIHINGDANVGGEIHKIGLATVADKLWNPGAFDPQKSLRAAMAMSAGREAVDDLLAFRDEFHKLHDGKGGTFERLEELLAACAKTCRNPQLLADLRGEIVKLKERNAAPKKR